MPRTINDIVQTELGVLHLALCQAQAENEALKERIAALEAAQPKPDPPNG